MLLKVTELFEVAIEFVSVDHLSYILTCVSPFSECSELFLTCGKSEIRVWSTKTNQEIVRITVPNMTCNAIAIKRCGSSIISGKANQLFSFFDSWSRIIHKLVFLLSRHHSFMFKINKPLTPSWGGGTTCLLSRTAPTVYCVSYDQCDA